MGVSLATVSSAISIGTGLVNLGIAVYHFIDEIRNKNRNRNRNRFLEDKRQNVNSTKNMHNQNLKYNKRDFQCNYYNDDVNFDEY